MRNLLPAALIIGILLFPFASCQDMFTTSLASGLSRSGYGISSSTSVDDLISIIKGPYGGDSSVAREVMDALGTKTAAELNSLSTEDKTTILNAATDATVDTGKALDILKSYDSSTSDTDKLISDILNVFDTNVDLGAVDTLLANSDVQNSVPVDTLVFASVVVLADVATEVGEQTIKDIVADPSTIDNYSLTPEQKARVENVIAVSDVLVNSRAQEVTDMGTGLGFDLMELLPKVNTPNP
ncbi:hypothetical protein K7I13_13500 [Brucepastera parasyntrophica]|uniref:hypothetical protein n=1 Tax=Brucepastera parasyntrophica TaxID=2880008 RepID=UPI00210F202E|nr:hypothetical protein [Brucepastera parasyntrophica]ULQ59473.1 hypothetical protein K7I13_13500 [Brucepastera parasyntrophica]